MTFNLTAACFVFRKIAIYIIDMRYTDELGGESLLICISRAGLASLDIMANFVPLMARTRSFPSFFRPELQMCHHQSMASCSAPLTCLYILS